VKFSENVNLTDTTETELIEIPNGFSAHMTLVYASNSDSAENTVTLSVEKDGFPNINVLGGKEVPANDYCMIESFSGFILQPGDVVKASTGTAGNVDVLVTLELVYSPFDLNRFGAGGN
jgi:hypothetical protein